MIIKIYPFIYNEEANYKIYYARNGTIPLNMESFKLIE